MQPLRVEGWWPSAALIALAAALVLSSSSTGASQRGDAKAAAHTVMMDGTAFVPPTIRVRVGDRITWTNTDPFPHTVTSREGRFDSKQIAARKSWTYQATRAGQFPYLCTLHPTMKGTLIVE